MYWLYEKKLDSGTHIYENPVYQPLAGNKNGLFFHAYKELSNARDEELWYASKRDLLSVLDCAPETHALVIDTAPRRTGVCLHEIHAAAGITAETWTPMMIWLEHVFQDDDPPSGKSLAAWKACFTDDGCPRYHIREFAYLKGGYAGGDWGWGGSRTGQVMLWPGSWEAFLTKDQWLEAHWDDG